MSSSNNLITFKEIFRDFVKLSYAKGYVSDKIRDLRVSELSIIRIDNKGVTLYKLVSGASFRIPWEWSDIFYAFNVEYGGEMEIIVGRLNEGSDYIDKFGCLLNGLISSIFNSSVKLNNPALFYNRLNSLIDLGTKNFIDWSKEELKITLRPFEFITIDDTNLI